MVRSDVICILVFPGCADAERKAPVQLDLSERPTC
jgi:hypothetical protein